MLFQFVKQSGALIDLFACFMLIGNALQNQKVVTTHSKS